MSIKQVFNLQDAATLTGLVVIIVGIGVSFGVSQERADHIKAELLKHEERELRLAADNSTQISALDAKLDIVKYDVERINVMLRMHLDQSQKQVSYGGN
jgi:hypothetical protein